MSDVLEAARVPGSAGLFVLGCFERNVSIYLQQVRALNLAWGLRDAGRVAVIGGGFAGLTAAAGLTALGVRVSLFERQPELLSLQRGNRVRWIHPHIHEWPRPGAEDPQAGLELLDWQAGYAGDVAQRIVGEFSRFDVDLRLNASCDLSEGWTVNGDPFEAVVLAVGLGVEKTFGKVPLHSYWLDRTIATPSATRKEVFVSGCGEGGLIDTLYLRLRDFRHDAVCRDCLRDVEPLRRALLDVESGVENADPREAGALLTAAYQQLEVPPRVDDCLRARLREDTRVTLNSPTPDFLTNKADILNRFLISRLVRMGAVEHVAGRLTQVEDDRVRLDTGLDRRFDQVLIRHGTEPALRSDFARFWLPYYEHRKGTPFQVPVPAWPRGAFSH
ncbi:MAG: FAD-dependent oxidoreductase [Candidatus Eremiobacterota bacterium]